MIENDYLCDEIEGDREHDFEESENFDFVLGKGETIGVI